MTMLRSLPTAASRLPARQRMIDLLDTKAWEHLGLTGQEFKLRWYAGEYLSDDRPEVLALDELMRTGVWRDRPLRLP
jgi:hypothetical protein